MSCLSPISRRPSRLSARFGTLTRVLLTSHGCCLCVVSCHVAVCRVVSCHARLLERDNKRATETIHGLELELQRCREDVANSKRQLEAMESHLSGVTASLTKARVTAVDATAEAALARQAAEDLRQQLSRAQASVKQLEKQVQAKAAATVAQPSTDLVRFEGDSRCVPRGCGCGRWVARATCGCHHPCVCVGAECGKS